MAQVVVGAQREYLLGHRDIDACLPDMPNVDAKDSYLRCHNFVRTTFATFAASKIRPTERGEGGFLNCDGTG